MRAAVYLIHCKMCPRPERWWGERGEKEGEDGETLRPTQTAYRYRDCSIDWEEHAGTVTSVSCIGGMACVGAERSEGNAWVGQLFSLIFCRDIDE